VADGTNASGANSSGDDAIGSLGQETIKLLRAIAAERMRPQDGPTNVTDAAVQIGRVVRDFLDKTMPPEK